MSRTEMRHCILFYFPIFFNYLSVLKKSNMYNIRTIFFFTNHMKCILFNRMQIRADYRNMSFLLQ
jgi:hypothetical protein